MILCFAIPSLAKHSAQQGYLLLEITKENSLQLTHKLDVRDAEILFKAVNGTEETFDVCAENCTFLLRFLQQQLQITASDTEIAFETIGAEIEGAFVYFYYETSQTALPIVVNVSRIRNYLTHFGYLVKLTTTTGNTTEFLGADRHYLQFNKLPNTVD